MMQSAILGKWQSSEITELSLLKYSELPLLFVPSLGLSPSRLTFEGPFLSVKILGERIKH